MSGVNALAGQETTRVTARIVRVPAAKVSPLPLGTMI
jgi:hypothetical protein